MKHLVDILLATYNGEKFLSEFLNSILAQTYPHLHIFVRDDCSKDSTLSILQNFAKAHPTKMTILPSEKNLGIKGNFSELMNHSKASYIMFADQDDRWLPSKVETSLNALLKMEQQYGSKTPLLIHTDLYVVGRNLESISSSFWKYSHLNPSKSSLNRLLAQNIVTGCTMILNRSLLELAQPISQAALMHDWWIALVAAAFGKIDYLNDQTILYRQHGGNDTGAKKHGLATFLQDMRKTIAPQTYLQADSFLKRYSEKLDLKTKNVIKAYASLGHLSLFQRQKTICRHRFFKQGFLRNLKALFFS